MKNNNILYKNFIKNLSEKKIFLVKIFANLIFQFFIAYIVLLIAENNNIIHNNYQLIGIVFAIFILIILMLFIKSLWLRFLLFCILSSLIGLMFSYKIDINNKEQTDIYKKAFLITIGIFIFMLCFAFFLIYFGVKIPYQSGIALYIILLLLIIFILIIKLLGKYSIFQKAISGTIILLFSLYIGYDTINIMDKNYDGDFVGASLDYFIDLLNIFSSTSNLI
jgi:modulator of FtsH protease